MFRKIQRLIASGWKNLTIEPVVFLYMVSVFLTYVIRPNLLIDKVCRVKLNLTSDICSNITENKGNLTLVQREVADYERTLSLAQSGFYIPGWALVR